MSIVATPEECLNDFLEEMVNTGATSGEIRAGRWFFEEWYTTLRANNFTPNPASVLAGVAVQNMITGNPLTLIADFEPCSRAGRYVISTSTLDYSGSEDERMSAFARQVGIVGFKMASPLYAQLACAGKTDTIGEAFRGDISSRIAGLREKLKTATHGWVMLFLPHDEGVRADYYEAIRAWIVDSVGDPVGDEDLSGQDGTVVGYDPDTMLPVMIAPSSQSSDLGGGFAVVPECSDGNPIMWRPLDVCNGVVEVDKERVFRIEMT